MKSGLAIAGSFFFASDNQTFKIGGMKYEFERIENFRDLGGLNARYGKTAEHVIYRSADVSRATEADLKKLEELGIKTVIDLRGPELRKVFPSPLKGKQGIHVIEIDIENGDKFPDKEEDIVDLYMSMYADGSATRAMVHALINEPKPILVHCMAGKDRTGINMALLQMANGVDRETICKDFLASYDNLPQLQQLLIEKGHVLPSFAFKANPAIINSVLDQFLAKYSGVENYLAGFGIPDDDIVAYCNLLGVQEQSAGAVVFYNNKVLIEHMRMGHYSMPKGHVEEGDGGLKETAKREIREETGLEARILDGFEASSVYSPKPGHIKEVRWFIAEVDSDKTVCQLEEVEVCYFLEPEDAYRVLSHDSDRAILKKACKYYFRQK